MLGSQVKYYTLRSAWAAGVTTETLREICKRVRWPKGQARLFGSSTKVEKGEEQGVLTMVHYGAPAGQLAWAGVLNQCPDACSGCIKACLGRTAGRMVFDSVRNAQNWKTLFVWYDPQGARTLARQELKAHRRKAQKLGKLAAARWNGTTDNPDFADSLETPDVVLYDYTKDNVAAWRGHRGLSPVHSTLSYNVKNGEECRNFLHYGGTVAVVFRTRDPAAFPKTWNGYPVINGDETDIRFRDPAGTVVGLTAKGSAMRDRTGWVQEIA